MINIINKVDCCGCNACFNICPKDCIVMFRDNEGFLYPKVNVKDCIECDLCVKVCPQVHPFPEPERKEQRAFIVQNKDENILRESTSGGAFSAIATRVLQEGGVVFGAAYESEEKLYVIHRYVEEESDLKIYRSSKYVQSDIQSCFREVKQFLLEGRLVCFSGTPCHVEGLLLFLRKKKYTNLILIDFVCRAVPSPLVLKKYIDYKGKHIKGTFTNILFRDKIYGYKYSNLSIYNQDKKLGYHSGIDSDPYLRAFFSGLSIRPSCTQCKFKKRYRESDLTLWDCFDVAKFSRRMDNDKGVTRIITHSSQGDRMIESIKPLVEIEEINSDKAVYNVKELTQSAIPNNKRDAFFYDLNILDSEIFFNKYFPITPRHKIEKTARLLSYHLGIYSLMKKVFKMLQGNREISR